MYQLIPVPSKSFELNLAQDLPSIAVDPVTGERIVHLHVTSLPPGSSKNTFAIWAGPDDDVHIVPSEVNARNLHLLNNPSSHRTQGVHVLAYEVLPVQTLSDQGTDAPLLYLRPEYAGQTVYVSVFDLDTGSQPPINFYIDTLAFTPDDSENGFDETQTDWAISHGFPGDPEGGCFTDPYNGACNDRFSDYAITLPSDLDCNGPSPDTCTPFYGGRLMARIQGGSFDGVGYDTYMWSVRWPVEEPPAGTEWDNTEGCSAFPIAVDQSIRSVSTNSTAANQWRTDFDYPTSPSPDYDSFGDHISDIPLLDAKPGYVYNIQNGASSGGKGWLAWNQCNATSASYLQASLTWPGNSKDYNPLGGLCNLNGEQMDRFSGFMEFGDNTDKSMHVDDWVTLNTGNHTSPGFEIL